MHYLHVCFSRQKTVTNHEFKFDHVFQPNASQDEVFTKAAVSTVEGGAMIPLFATVARVTCGL